MSRCKMEQSTGEMMPLGANHVLAFFEHPRLIDLSNGETVMEFEQIQTGSRFSSMNMNEESAPMIACDPAGMRCAISGDDSITILEFSDTEKQI